MKKAITLLIFLLIAMPVLAQEQTLISRHIESGGFGGPVVKFTQIKDQFGLLVGGRGGWIINHTLVLGGGGYGLFNKIPTVPSVQGDADSLYLNMGYGGFELGFVFNSNKLIHMAFQTLIGAGGVSHTNWTAGWVWNDEDKGYESDSFFIMEPSVDIVLNVTSFFRIAAGFSYRYISGVDLSDISDSDLSGFSGQIILKFGSF